MTNLYFYVYSYLSIWRQLFLNENDQFEDDF